MKDLSKIVLTAVLCALALWLSAALPAAAADLEVCKTCTFTSVAAAIQQAQPHDRIIVNEGIYNERNIEINKPLTLLGKGKPVLDAQNKGGIFEISSNHVTIQGFEFRNVEVSYMKDYAAVKVLKSNHVTITDNTVFNTFFGIYLQNSDSCKITRNIVKGQARTETSSGNAIHLWYSNDILVEENDLSGHRDGIYLEFVKDSRIEYNHSHENIRYGLHFMFSDGNVYTHNIFRKNGAGVAVMYTRNIRMEHNLFEHNWGSASYGLLLKDISRSTISHNHFFKNTTGIYMEGSSYLDISKNTFQENGWAIRLLSSCNEDTFRLNNFLTNTFDISTNGKASNNYFEKNYWDKYQGYDLNKDKTGDVPYRPVSLYSLVVEKVPSSIMFLRSFIVDLMDKLEKVIPSFTPQQLIDEQPMMKRYAYDHDRIA